MYESLRTKTVAHIMFLKKIFIEFKKRIDHLTIFIIKLRLN